MKPSEFLKIYKALVNLYGAIVTDDAYPIIKKYYPNILKKDLYKDLKKRVNKFTRWYAVYRTTGHNYLIASEFMSFDDVDCLFGEQMNKPRYVPDTLEEFLRYSEPTYVEENGAFDIAKQYLIDVLNFEPNKAYIETILMVGRIRNGLRLQDTINAIEKDYTFKDENDVIEFVRIYQLLNNNTRLIENCGHTPSELFGNVINEKGELIS